MKDKSVCLYSVKYITGNVRIELFTRYNEYYRYRLQTLGPESPDLVANLTKTKSAAITQKTAVEILYPVIAVTTVRTVTKTLTNEDIAARAR